MTFTYRHDNRSFTAEIHRIGPAIQVVAFEGEFYASLAVGYIQSGQSVAAITKWEVDGPAECQQLTGTNADWDRYWASIPRDHATGASRGGRVVRGQRALLRWINECQGKTRDKND